MSKKAKQRQSKNIEIFSPDAQVESFRKYLSDQEYQELKQEINVPLLPTIRINPLKTSYGFVEFLSKRYGWQLQTIPFCNTGFKVITGSGPQVSSTIEHKLGLYYIQEAASMLPVELFDFDPSKSDLTLDMTASPGGKTIHIVDRLLDQGLVIANDSSQSRIQALRIVLQNWGATNTAVTHFPGEKFGGWFPETFARVLIDAPCSMQGLRMSESHSSRTVTPKESKTLARRQTALLTSALQAVKVGGEVVYSTCTLLPAEDEEVVDQVLNQFHGAIEVLNANSKIPEQTNGLTEIDGRPLDASLSHSIRLWPHRYHTAGFFACLIRKIKPLELQSIPVPEHSMEKAGFNELTDKECSFFCNQVEESTGFQLQGYLEEKKRVLVRKESRYFLFPQLFMEKFKTLPVQSVGMQLGNETPDGFFPSHEWVSRFGKDCIKVVIPLTHSDTQKWMNGEDLPNPNCSKVGGTRFRVIVDESGYVLGLGKTMGDRIKNLTLRRLL